MFVKAVIGEQNAPVEGGTGPSSHRARGLSTAEDDDAAI